MRDKLIQPNMMILSPNSIINIKQTFNNYGGQPESRNRMLKSQILDSQNRQPRVRKHNPQSMQFTDDFANKIVKQSLTTRNKNLDNIIQSFSSTLHSLKELFSIKPASTKKLKMKNLIPSKLILKNLFRLIRIIDHNFYQLITL